MTTAVYCRLNREVVSERDKTKGYFLVKRNTLFPAWHISDCFVVLFKNRPFECFRNRFGGGAVWGQHKLCTFFEFATYFSSKDFILHHRGKIFAERVKFGEGQKRIGPKAKKIEQAFFPPDVANAHPPRQRRAVFLCCCPKC